MITNYCKNCEKPIRDEIIIFEDRKQVILSMYEDRIKEDDFKMKDAGLFCSAKCLIHYLQFKHK